MRILSILLVAGAIGYGAHVATGEDGGPGDVSESSKATIDDIGFGTHWFGPEITAEDLRGKVVLLEIWGS